MTFRRVLKIITALLGFLAGILAVIVALFTRRMIAPARQTLWTSPGDMGMAFENVNFPANDSVRLSGWFIPATAAAARDGATVILSHDWTWNRLGDAAADVLANLSGTVPVELLRLAHALHIEGFHVLMFDQRNHGESASHPPVTFGQSEANDLLGALAYLRARPEVADDKIGVIGFGMGANAILYALPQSEELAAAVAVQPMTINAYIERYTDDLLGMPARVVRPLAETLYDTIGGVPLNALQPAFPATGAGATPVLFVQSRADAWGSAEDAGRLAAATPRGEGPLYVNGSHRYQGYLQVIENPDEVVAFLERQFSG